MKRWYQFLGLSMLIIASVACEMTRSRSVIGPGSVSDSSSGGGNFPSLIGTWTNSKGPSSMATTSSLARTSDAAAPTCTSIQWQVTSQNGPSVSGQFSMTCDSILLTGTATGQINGSNVTVTLNGS